MPRTVRRALPDGRRLEITERDRAILRDLERWGCLSAGQIARLHFTSAVRAYARLGHLSEARLVVAQRLPGVPRRVPRFYVPTPRGARLIGLELAPRRRGRLARFHDLNMFELAMALLAEQPGASWYTRRELDSYPDAGLPVWRSAFLDSERIVPSGALVKGRGKQAEVTAVELELPARPWLTVMGLIQVYRALIWGRGTFRAPYTRVVWFYDTLRQGELPRSLDDSSGAEFEARPLPAWLPSRWAGQSLTADMILAPTRKKPSIPGDLRGMSDNGSGGR